MKPTCHRFFALVSVLLMATQSYAVPVFNGEEVRLRCEYSTSGNAFVHIFEERNGTQYKLSDVQSKIYRLITYIEISYQLNFSSGESRIKIYCNASEYDENDNLLPPTIYNETFYVLRTNSSPSSVETTGSHFTTTGADDGGGVTDPNSHGPNTGGIVGGVVGGIVLLLVVIAAVAGIIYCIWPKRTLNREQNPSANGAPPNEVHVPVAPGQEDIQESDLDDSVGTGQQYADTADRVSEGQLCRATPTRLVDTYITVESVTQLFSVDTYGEPLGTADDLCSPVQCTDSEGSSSACIIGVCSSQERNAVYLMDELGPNMAEPPIDEQAETAQEVAPPDVEEDSVMTISVPIGVTRSNLRRRFNKRNGLQIGPKSYCMVDSSGIVGFRDPQSLDLSVQEEFESTDDKEFGSSGFNIEWCHPLQDTLSHDCLLPKASTIVCATPGYIPSMDEDCSGLTEDDWRHMSILEESGPSKGNSPSQFLWPDSLELSVPAIKNFLITNCELQSSLCVPDTCLLAHSLTHSHSHAYTTISDHQSCFVLTDTPLQPTTSYTANPLCEGVHNHPTKNNFVVDENNVDDSVTNRSISAREGAVDTHTLDYHCDRGRTRANVTSPPYSQPHSSDNCLSSANHKPPEHSNAELLVQDDLSISSQPNLHSLQIRQECTGGTKVSKLCELTQSPRIYCQLSVAMSASIIADCLLKMNGSLLSVHSCAYDFLRSVTRPTCIRTELADHLITELREEECPEDSLLMDQSSLTRNVLLNPAIVVGS